MRFNRHGIVVMGEAGRVQHDSQYSALSHKSVGAGGVLLPVPDTDGLHLRLLPKEAEGLNKRDKQSLFARARAVFQDMQEVPVPEAGGEPGPDDEDNDED